MSFSLSSGNYLSRSGGVPASHQSFSACGWFYRSADSGASEYILHFGTGTNPIQVRITATDTLRLNLQYSSSRYVDAGAVSTGEWVFFALVCTTTATFYWRREGETSLSSGTAANSGSDWTTDNIYVGREATSATNAPFTGLVACLRVWDTTLTVNELQAESESLTAVKTTSLLSDHRGDGADIAAAVEDDHTSNNDFTATGTPTVSASEPTVTVGGGGTHDLSGGDDLPVITAVNLAPTTVSAYEGDTEDLTVTVKDQDGIGIPYLTGTHTSSDTAVATVSQLAVTDSDGRATVRLTAVADGTCTVTSTFDGVDSNTSAITVSDQPVTLAVDIVPASASLTAGDTQTFTATLNDSTLYTFTWSIVTGVGSVSSAGVYTATSAGTATIRATVVGDSTLFGDATVTVVAADSAGTGAVSTTWKKRNGTPVAGVDLDYWIISSDDVLITSGTATTDANGTLTVTLSRAYSGERVLVVINNLDSDMDTAGKINGQQVVTVG